ncbi:hypothetical protein RHGRI_029855 [Rhododendron griersonianum]|uniref:Protein FAR1-RELATED SEQUENCE n=1 Tax=Rhododendron griersonianum TaxID=479676 RepID=A0AAV6IRW0_9ERIC|nr:hypothetical protein RHGRI_029855 [Rhododendron griersonianum]
MEGENQAIGGFQASMGLTDEDFSELTDIINLTATKNIEEMSEFYKSFRSNNDSGSVEEQMPIVENGESRELPSLLLENFSTREELLDRVRNVALKEGYVTTIKKSKPGYYVIIGCDRGGQYRGISVPLNERKKISGSRLINCPFELWGKKKGVECWKVEIKNASHNHEPSSDMSGHPYCRRFSNEEVLSIKRMTMAGIPPREILTSLRLSNPNCKAIARTVYNAKATITKEVLAGRTMIQALFDELGQGDFTFDIKRDGNGHLTHLFFAHPSSIALTKGYPYVFVMDCTYKTNKCTWNAQEISHRFHGNFHEVREKICLAIENQYNEIKAKIASEKLRVTHKFQIPILKELVSHVSNFALGELFKQNELATSSILGPCRGHFSKTMGLPCAHMMTNKKGESLLLSDIHPQWRIDTRSFTNVDGGVDGNGSEIERLLKNFLDKYKCMPLVEREDCLKQVAQLIDSPIPLTLEPSIQPHKGRPSGSKKRKGDGSTTRDPSAFEIAEKTRKCSICHHVGHNSRTCPHKDENTRRSPHSVLANQHVNLNMLETQFECEINTSLEL